MFTDNNGNSYINSTGQEFSAPFSNTIIPNGPHTLRFAQRGGQRSKSSKSISRKVNKRKIKNISNMYKMPARKLKHYKKSLKRKLNGTKKRSLRIRFNRGRRSRKYKHMKGGSTVSYAMGGLNLPPNQSALANGLYSVIQGSSLPYNHFAMA